MRKEMEAFISSNNLKERVHLPGARPDVATPLSAMNLFLLTSEFEGTPNVVLEAQWLGLPVVVTDAGGAREAFDDGTTGRLAKESSAEHIAKLVDSYLEDDAFLREAASAGPKFVERVFGVERLVRETLDLYQRAHSA